MGNGRRQRAASRAVLLAAGMLAAAAQGGAQVDLVVDVEDVGTFWPGFRIAGARSADRFGSSVSGAGDVNGDGFSDVIVGAPDADRGCYAKADGSRGARKPTTECYRNAGYSYVVFGGPGVPAVDVADLGSGGFVIEGVSSGETAGCSVSGAGDVNGDGLADLVLGAEGGSVPGKAGAGRSYVVFGKAGASAVDLKSLGGLGFRINGNWTEGRLGLDVSGAGDVNGDGLADMVISSLRGYGGVVFGKATDTPVESGALGDGGFRIGASGKSATGAQDIDGDGLADLVLGGWSRSPDLFAGESYVVFGKETNSTVSLLDGDGGFFRMDGVDHVQSPGRRVSGAGDVNGDGIGDVVVGVFEAARNSPVAYVVFGKVDESGVDLEKLGKRGFEIAAIDGANGGSIRRSRVSGCGDVNGDGFADIIVGAPYSRSGFPSYDHGESYVVFGKATNEAVDLNILGEGGFRISATGRNGLLGTSVSGAGDVNGDGLADIVVGEPYAYTSWNQKPGNAHVLFSPMLAPPLPTYLAHARGGDAPPLAIGVVGDGSDDDSPWSRCWIDFAGGNGPGTNGASLQTATLLRNNDGIRFLHRERLANVHWLLETDRLDWTRKKRTARITLKYTDAEVAGLREDTLRVRRASTLAGPWAVCSSGVTHEPQRNRIGVDVPALGYFLIEGEPLVDTRPEVSGRGHGHHR